MHLALTRFKLFSLEKQDFHEFVKPNCICKFIVAQLSTPISAHNLGNCKTNYPIAPWQSNRMWVDMFGCTGTPTQLQQKVPKWQLRFEERRREGIRQPSHTLTHIGSPPGPPPLAKQPSARISRHGHVSSSGSERPTSIDNIEKRMQARLVAVVITLYRRYKDTHCSCPCSRSRPLLVPGFCYCFSIWCAPGIGWNPHLWAAANGICGNDLWNVRWLEAKILSQVKWIWVNQVAAGCSKLVLVRINRIYMNLWKTKLIFVVFYIHRKWRLGLNLRGILECGMRG